MDQVTKIGQWRALLDSLNTEKNNPQLYRNLRDLFEHLSPQAAIRLQKDLKSCTLRTIQIFSDLFDSIDLSDKPLLCSYLRMLQSFGNFRLTQITYHITTVSFDLESDVTHHPIIEKVKWYDMTPLLPNAGTIGWKAIMNHGIVKEETELMHVCLELLKQKLHFYSIIQFLEQFKDSSAVIRRNGEKVAEKLLELIRDVANDDESMIGLDAYLFNLLLPFIDENQQAAIVEATVQDLFKPYLIQKPVEEDEYIKMFELINQCIMPSSDMQAILINKIFEHLRCNVIRRKRRHSVESAQENEYFTFESIIQDINSGAKLTELLEKSKEVKLDSKSLQTGYLSHWIEMLSKVISQKTLTASSAIKILQLSSTLLVATSSFISDQLSGDISTLMVRAVENTVSRIALSNSCNSLFLVSLTSKLLERTNLLEDFNSPILQFYRAILSNSLELIIYRGKVESDKVDQFISLICSKAVSKTGGHVLQYVCVNTIANLCTGSKHKYGKKLASCLDYARTCSRKLHNFIKRHSPSALYLEQDRNETELDEQETHRNRTSDAKVIIVIDALICILKVAVEYRDQEILDSYSDLLLRLYSAVKHRIEKLTQSTQEGSKELQDPLDVQLSKLLVMYADHKELIKPYLNEDLIEAIAHRVIDSQTGSKKAVTIERESAKVKKKVVYSQIKSKLDDLDARSKKSDNVYATLINKHYGSGTDQTIGTSDSMHKERSCFLKYQNQMKNIQQVLLILLNKCSQETYNRVSDSTISELENCDPLDHSKVLYILLVLESLISKRHNNSKDNLSNKFLEMLPKISCSLIRISKTVEFGPSIRIFTTSGGHKSNRSIQCCTYASCIKIYTQMFLNYPPKVTDSLIPDAMQLCVSSNLIQYSKYSSRLHKFFIQLASAIVGLLKAICMGRKDEEVLKSSMPAYLSVFSHLIRCLVMASDRQKLDDIPRLQLNGHTPHETDMDVDRSLDDLPSISVEYESQLELIALDVGRTMNNLSFLKVKLVDYAPHLISTYIKDVQRASCPESVRLHLNEGIFRIFNLVDAHQKERREEILSAGVQRKTSAGRAKGSLFEMIHARLDQASREIFRDMHDNYSRFYRYSGKC